MIGLIEIAFLAPHEMVAQHLAMVAGEDHQRMAVLAGRLEVSQQAADLIVDLADHPVVGGAQLAQLALVDVLQHRGVMLGIEADIALIVEGIGEIGMLSAFNGG